MSGPKRSYTNIKPRPIFPLSGCKCSITVQGVQALSDNISKAPYETSTHLCCRISICALSSCNQSTLALTVVWKGKRKEQQKTFYNKVHKVFQSIFSFEEYALEKPSRVDCTEICYFSSLSLLWVGMSSPTASIMGTQFCAQHCFKTSTTTINRTEIYMIYMSSSYSTKNGFVDP